MPFEPLRTDEKLDVPQPRERDLDSQMIVGCSGFGVVAILTYGLGIWPHFAFTQTHLVRTLLMAGLFGVLPALVLGFVGMRKFGLAGACGFVGGTMATAVFLFLRMKQAMMGKYSRDPVIPEYPENWVWIVPLVLVMLAVALSLVGMPRGEFGQKDLKKP